jgi:hypothetical protein
MRFDSLELTQLTTPTRYQDVGETCLATIEAIYCFYQEFILRARGTYAGEVDSLLAFFVYQYRTIQQSYRSQPDRQFKRISNYIKYKGDGDDAPAAAAAAAAAETDP